MEINVENWKAIITDRVFSFIDWDFKAENSLAFQSARIEGMLDFARDLNILTHDEWVHLLQLLLQKKQLSNILT